MAPDNSKSVDTRYPAKGEGVGPCMVAECGCREFIKALGSTAEDPTCVGANAAGGSCNHLKSEHR
jgi:hypothetical protein